MKRANRGISDPLQMMLGDARISRHLAGSPTMTIPLGINTSGDIVGSYFTGHDRDQFGFLYHAGNYTTLDILGIETLAWGINDSGHIVGSYIEEEDLRAFKRHGFFYTNGLYATFDHPASRKDWEDTVAQGINNAGHIVGTYSSPTGLKGFLYINGLYATIDYPSARQTNAYAINDDGEIVGFCVDRNGMDPQGFLLSGGTYASFKYPLARWTTAMGINNHRQIVGSILDSTNHSGAFLYNPSSATFASINYPSADNTYASGINDNGQIVGTYSKDGLGHGFIYNLNGGTYTTFDLP
jgi:uncharacterized membrane protein